MGFEALAESFAGQVRSMEVGETMAKVQRVAVGSKGAKKMSDDLAKLRNGVNQAVNRAKRDGSDFRVESGCYITDDKANIILAVSVTKISASVEI